MGQTQPSESKKAELLSSYEDNCKRVAEALVGADYFLLATGAGFSADSGLAGIVYKDIADVEAYRKRDLTYADLCVPLWLDGEPELFYGFWGSCFNDYRETEPHEGYHIIKRWRDRFFNDPEFALQDQEQIKAELLEKAQAGTTLHKEGDAEESPGRFFVLTSNVDAHMVKAGFKNSEVFEIHGNTESWQCSEPYRCCKKLWRAPAGFRFKIDKSTMLAEGPGDATLGEKKGNSGFGTNFPVCQHCDRLARPSVVMFSDGNHIEDSVPLHIFSAWSRTVQEKLVEDSSKKAVVIEIGCGSRVPSIRIQSEGFFTSCPEGQCIFIRINPDFPLPDSSRIKDNFISLMGKGLESLRKIDGNLKKIDEKPEEK